MDQHDVWHLDSGTKRCHHPVVGELTLHYDGLDLAGQPGVQLTVLTAEPGSPDADGLRLLRTWAGADSDADPRARTTR